MPEFAEVYVITKDLQPLKGSKLLSIKNRSKFKLNSKLLIGSEVIAIANRGKYIIFTFDSGLYLTIHLGMTGKLLYQIDKKESKHLKLTLKFEDQELFFCDPRGFGRISISSQPPATNFIDPREKGYSANLKRRLLARNAPVFSLLLDQKIAFGVGSYLAQESLFRAGIAPTRTNLNEHEVEVIDFNLRKVLKLALKLNGATISDYRRLNGEKGRMQEQFKVYRRKDLPCLSCGRVIERIVIAGRGVYYCPGCQV